MRTNIRLITFIFLLILGACGEVQDPESRIFTIDSSSSKKWELHNFPLNVSVSQSFSSDEFNVMEGIGQKWADSASFTSDFFDFYFDTNEKAYPNLNSYYDNEIGVYLLAAWPVDLPSDALAVTQTFGEVVNAGTVGQYTRLLHFDILFNDEYFDFAHDYSFGTYHLQSVLIHELGHALGLSHYLDNNDSVMTPEIYRWTVFTDVFQVDSNNLNNLYDPGSPIASSSGRSPKIFDDSFYLESFNQEDRVIRIIHQLKRDTESTKVLPYNSKLNR